MKKNIIYQGKKFTIEWYYDQQGKSSALEYFKNLPDQRKEKIFYLCRLMAEMGSINSEQKFVHEGDQIYAFKPQPDRFLCFFFIGGKIIITNAFEKKTQKIPVREKEKALKYQLDYEIRIKKGTYYE